MKALLLAPDPLDRRRPPLQIPSDEFALDAFEDASAFFAGAHRGGHEVAALAPERVHVTSSVPAWMERD